MAHQRLPRLDHGAVGGAVVGGERPRCQFFVGGAQYLGVAREPDVRQDATTEEECLAGEILGEEQRVTQAVEGPVEVAVWRDGVEKLLLLGSPVAGSRSIRAAASLHRHRSRLRSR